MAKISLPLIGLTVEPELWDSLIRQFSIENQYESGFLARDFLEMTAEAPRDSAEMALTDTLDFIKFETRRRLATALQEKYRIGTEFADEPDAEEIFDKAFVSAEAAAMKVLRDNTYTLNTLIYVEVFYWVMLQLLRMDRGEYVDRKYQGNQARMGSNLDLAGEQFAAIASRFYAE